MTVLKSLNELDVFQDGCSARKQKIARFSSSGSKGAAGKYSRFCGVNRQSF